ncbi:exo-alpha-sialidase [Helicobacter sp. MIT 21-1697]|uniref:sialidase family protein n=1 Tax=Helicobacter sp. MIT 21-1697 TaxID=2993733 RepID=UPI00224A62A1|nr:sialidase family protein [Helicobacter sp. MIT 21-1697]MCX2716776.1 exo-alpha-sialidase [Helicobacter sp. MIT 21-1697]
MRNLHFLKYLKHSIFVFLLCLCAWWVFINDKTPKNTLDFSQQTLVLPEQNPLSPKSNTLSQAITYFDIPNSQASAHASAIVNVSNVSDKDFMLLYFAGSREGARDVGIYQSFFTFNKNRIDSEIGQWSKPTLLLDAPTLSALSGKFIKKLGNPITFVDTQGRVHLFVVGVSMGGWATSKIYWLLLESPKQENKDSKESTNIYKQNLHTLHYVQELHLSPLLNLSFLVRTPAMLKSDGGFILPIYHELARKYPLLLEFSSSLEITSIMRPTRLHSQLQPSFVPRSSHSSIGVYRNHKAYEHTLYVSECSISCALPKPSNLKNYDASSVLFNALDSIFLLHNQAHSPQGNKREELWIYTLLQSSLEDSQVIFEPLLRLDRLLGNEVSYPSVAMNESFVFIAYTHGRTHIKTALVPKSLLKESLKQDLQFQQ